MSVTKKDIELIIRATNLSQRPLGDVVKSVNSVVDALEAQVKAAQAGEASAEELTSALKSLKDAGEGLIRQQALIDRYKQLALNLDASKEKAQQAAAAYEKLKTEQSALDTVTKAQQSSLDKLFKAQTRANDAVGKAEAQLVKQAEVLSRNGIEAESLGEAQAKILDTTTKVATSTNTLNAAVSGLAKAQRDRVAQSKEQAAAERELAAEERELEDINKRLAASQARRQAEDASFKRQADAAEHLRKELEYVSLFVPVLDRLEAKEKQLASDAALQKKADADLKAFRALADQINSTAKGYQTLGAEASRVAVGSARTTGATSAVQSITQPRVARLTTAGGITDEVNEVAAAIGKIRGPVKDYADTVNRLRAAMKAVGEQADVVDGLSRQEAAVAGARAAYERLAAEVVRVEAQVRSATAPDEELAASLRNVRSAAAQAETSLEKESATLERMSVSARKAGIDTANLEKEEERLVGTARQATNALDGINKAHAKYGDAVDRSTKRSGFFQVGERQSLSLIQRLRGEVLGLAAAYVGLQGAIGLANESIDAKISKQSTENRLAIVVGNNQKAIGDEYNYIHDQADRLGIGIGDLAENYSRFGIAAKNGGLNLQETRYIFERVSEAMRVNGASTEAISGAWYQFEQMISKGKVQLEDLRQASNWIPGLEGALAKGLQNLDPKKFAGLSDEVQKIGKAKGSEGAVAALFAAMKKGSVDARVAMIALSDQFQKDYAERLPTALKSLQAQQGRFNTSLNDFKLAIADGGFADAFASMLERLTKFMNSDDGAKAAQKLSDGFSAVADAVVWVVENFDTLKAVLEVIATIKIAQWAVGAAGALGEAAANAAQLSRDLGTMGKASEAAGTSVGVGTRALQLFKAALGIVSAAVIGWEIGTYLNEKFGAVRVAADYAVVGLLALSTNSKYVILSVVQGAIDLVLTMFDNVKIKLAEFYQFSTSLQAKFLTAVGQGDAAKKLQGIFGDPEAMRKQADAAKAERQRGLDALKKDRDDARKLQDQTLKDMVDYDKKSGDLTKKKDEASKKAADATATPGDTRNINGNPIDEDKLAKAAERLAQKRAAIESNLAEQLRQIDARIEKRQTDSLEGRLSAIDLQYQRLYENLAKLEKLGGKSVTVKDENGADVTYTIAQYKAQLESMKEILKTQETEAFNKQNLKKLEDDLNEATAERTNRIKEVSDLLASGGIDATEAYKRTSEVFDELNPKIADAAKKAKDFAASAVGKGVTANQSSALGAKADRATDPTTQQSAAMDIVEAGEKRINDLVKQRKDIIQANNDLVNLGLITQKDAQDDLEKQNARLGPQIAAQADKLLDLIRQLHDAGALSDEQYDLAIAKTKALRSQSVELSAAMTQARDLIINGIGQGAADTFDAAAKSLAGLIDGTMSWGEALKNVRNAMLSFFADFLRQIAQAILKQYILNSLQKSSGGGGWVGALVGVVGALAGGGNGGSAGATAASVNHTGGVIGQGGGVTRQIPTSWLAGAPRYHTGTVGAGLSANEQTAILEKGEEVLKRTDPRHTANGGRRGGSPVPAAATPLQQVLLLDPNEIHKVAATKDGQNVTMTNIKANIATLKQWLK